LACIVLGVEGGGLMGVIKEGATRQTPMTMWGRGGLKREVILL
jgi:hypothetical protein